MAHILEHARIASDILDGKSNLVTDTVQRLALERALYIIGEAANHLSEQTRLSIKQPWRRIIGLRVILAHQYEVVEPAILQRIARENIPELIRAVDSYLNR